jgi:hypothetical protein
LPPPYTADRAGCLAAEPFFVRRPVWEGHGSFEAAFARLLEDLKAPTSTDEKTKEPGRKGLPKQP